MPVKFSSAGALDTGRFYTAIHQKIQRRPKRSPSHQEFVGWLDMTFPQTEGLIALDAGMGLHASNARACLEKGFQVEAVDLNDEAVEANADIGAHKGSLLDLPYQSDHFDLVVCSGVVHHTPDPDRSLAELFRVLKPGGVAYISLYTFRRSPFEYVVRLLRMIGRLVPFRWAHALMGHIPAINNFVLDHMYVPLMWVFTTREALGALQRAGFDTESHHRTSFDPFGRFSGGGLLRIFICRKP